MKRRFWKIAVLLAVPLALYAGIAAIVERNSWRPRTIKTYAVEPGHLQFSADGRTLILEDSDLYICDLTTDKSIEIRADGHFFIEGGQYIVALCFSKNSALAGEKILSVPDGTVVASLPKDFIPLGVLADEATIIGRKNDDIYDRSLFRWNWRSNSAPSFFVRLSEAPSGGLTILPDKATLTDKEHFWDLSTGKLRFQIPPHFDIRFGVVNSTSQFILSDKKKVQIWNYQTGKMQRSGPLDLSLGPLSDLTLSPDATTLAGLIRKYIGTPQACLWDIQTGRRLRQISLAGDSVYALAISPDGRNLVVASTNKVQLWRIK